jgi:hypothetical protein
LLDVSEEIPFNALRAALAIANGAVGELPPSLAWVHNYCNEITYNPHKFESFVYKEDRAPIVRADLAICLNNKVYVKSLTKIEKVLNGCR